MTHKPKILSGITTQWNLKACLGHGLSKGLSPLSLLSLCRRVYVSMCATPLPKKKEKRKKTIFIMLLIQYTASPASKHTHTHHTTDPHTSPLPDLSLRNLVT